MRDMHGPILPGVDQGARSLEPACGMVEVAAAVLYSLGWGMNSVEPSSFGIKDAPYADGPIRKSYHKNGEWINDERFPDSAAKDRPL